MSDKKSVASSSGATKKQSEEQIICQNERLTYKKRKGTSGIGGQLYETKLLTLILFNALNHDDMELFYLGTNVDQVGAFDDVVFKYKLQGRDKARVVLIQAKHKEDPLKYNITREEVLKTNGDFSLHKYFASYIDLINKFGPKSDDSVFKDGLDSVELDLIIYTPAGEMITNKNNTTEHPNKDFLTKNPTGQQFRFHYDEKDIKCLIKTAQIVNVKQLAQKLAQYVTGKQIIRELMSDELNKYYHVILKDKVIDVSSETLTDNKSNIYRKAKFRTSFLKNSSNKKNILSVFKKAIFEEIVCNRKLNELILNQVVEKINMVLENQSEGTISELIGNVLIYNAKNNSFKLSQKSSHVIPHDIKRRVETITVAPNIVEKAIEIAGTRELEQLEFVLPELFGNFDIKLTGTKQKQQKRLKHLASMFINLFKNKKVTNNNVVTITDSMIGTDVIKQGEIDLNGGIAGLVGNLLILGEENKLKFNMDQNTLPENAKILIQKIQDKLLLDNELQNIQIEVIKFNIKVNGFPKLSLIDENYERDLLTKFLDKLEFHTNQANEEQIENELKKKISNTYEIMCSDKINNFVLDVHNQVQRWWRSEDYYLNESCDFFDYARERIINYPLLNHFRNVFLDKINRMNIEFSNESIKFLNIENVIRNSHKRIYNIVTESTVLSSVKIVQKFIGTIDILDLDYLLSTEKYDLDIAMKEFLQKNSKVNLLLIICNNKYNDEEKFINKLCEKFITVKKSNKIIVISQQEITLLLKKIYCNSATDVLVKVDDIKITFNDLRKESQQSFLENEKVIFQGKKMTLQELMDNNPHKVIDLKILDMLVRNKLDTNKKTFEIGISRPHLSDLESIYYIACKNIERGQFLNAIEKNPLDLFFITGTTKVEFVQLFPELSLDKLHILKDDKNNSKKQIILTHVRDNEKNMEDFKWVLRNYSVTKAHVIEIGGGQTLWKRTYDLSLYIHRKLYYTIVDKSKLVSILESTWNSSSKKLIFAVSGIEVGELEKLLNVKVPLLDDIFSARNMKNHLIALNEKSTKSDFEKLCDDNKSLFNIHWLQYKESNLVWRRSVGDISIIREMIQEQCKLCVDQNNLDEIINNEQITIITDEPGMGKSTSLTHLLQSNPGMDMWIIKLNLVNIQDQLGKITNVHNIDSIIDDLFSKLDVGVRDTLSKNMLKYRIETQGKITLLFDGFDEITEENQKIIIEILTFLKNTKAKVQITSRLHLRDKLENAFSTFAYSFQPFRKQDQELLLTNFWSSSIKLTTGKRILKKEVNKLCEPFYKNIQDEKYEFMSIPLLTRMFAEIYQEVIEENPFENSNSVNKDLLHDVQRLSILEMYERFIQRKYDIYFNDKLKISYIDRYATNALKKALNKDHQCMAMQLIFPMDESINILACANKLYFQETKDNLKIVGIIQSINNSSEAFFSHKTFAEYFCAARLVKLITTPMKDDSKYHIARRFLSRHIFKEDYCVIRKFFDLMLAKDEFYKNEYSIHNAIIYKDLSKVQELLKQNVGSFIDRGGRSPLHLAAAYGCKDIFQIILSKINDNNGLINLNDTLLDWSPLVYAAQYNHWNICKSLLDRGAKIEDIDKIQSITFKKNSKTILHFLIENASNNNLISYILMIAKESIDKKNFYEFINNNDLDMKTTALHLAARHDNTEIVKLLLEEGADVNTPHNIFLTKLLNIYVYTPLYCLLHEHSRNFIMNEQTLVTFKMLLNKGADISICGGPISINPHEIDCHYYARINEILHSTKELFRIVRKLSCEDIVQLINQGAIVNAKYEGKTPLHYAAQNGNVDHVIVLLKNNALIYNLHSDREITPLHEAVKREHLEVVKVLLDNSSYNSIPDNYNCNEVAGLGITKYPSDKYYLINKSDSKNNTPLFYAVQNGNVQIVKALLENKANIYTTDNISQVPLLEVAIWNGNFRVTKMLLEHDANINATNVDESMPLLHYAARGLSEDVVKILQEGVDVNVHNDKTGWAALHLAAVWGYSEIIKILIEHGANNNLQNYMRWTPLHIATLMGHIEVVTDLLEARADVNVKDRKGRTPIYYAAWRGNINLVSILLQKKTALDIDEYEMTPLHYASSGYKEITNTLLDQGIAHINCAHAAIERHVEVIHSLLDRGVAINSKDGNIKTPLHYAAMRGHTDVVRALIDRGADINDKDKLGMIPLDYAAIEGRAEVVHMLLDEGADINSMDKEGMTPLHYAVQSGHVEIAHKLLKSGADINSKDKNGAAPLHCAAVRGYIEVVHALLDWGAAMNSETNTIMTPLHCAAKEGHVAVVNLLLGRGADINSKDENGLMPLHFAAWGGHLDVVLILIYRGAAINSKDKDGMTPANYAAKAGHAEVVFTLITHMPLCQARHYITQRRMDNLRW